MLANIVVCTSLLVLPLESLETRVGHVFLVHRPADASGFEKIYNSGDIAGDLVEVVVVHAEVITSNGSSIVGLRRVSDSEVIIKSDTLAGQPGQVWVTSSLVKIGVFLLAYW